MKVLVSGSMRDMDPTLAPQCTEAARDLGRELAASGHALIVGSENPEDVDPFVVEGYRSAGKAIAIEVHLQKGAPACYVGSADVRNVWHRYHDWDVTVLEVVRYDAQAVIVLGGRKGVIQAGIAGWMLGRPTIAFGGFGGGAQKVWEYGSSDRRRFYFDALSDEEIDQLDSPWGPKSGGAIVDRLGRCAMAATRASVPKEIWLGLGVGTLLSLMAWVALLAIPVWDATTPTPQYAGAGSRFLFLMGAVCAAGVFGAMVQCTRVIRDGRPMSGQKVWIDGVLGLSAGFLTAALYMLAQVAIVGKLQFAEPIADHSRVALIVSMAAVFASLYIDAAYSRFDMFKDSVMSGTYGRDAQNGGSH